MQKRKEGNLKTYVVIKLLHGNKLLLMYILTIN